jgi:peptidyl-prolyl cis-trans isomerase D
MLTTIREKTQGIIAGFVVTLVAIPFTLWGVHSYVGGDSSLAVAKVNDIEITQQTYRNALDQFRQRVNPDVLDSRQFKEFVLEGLIDQALLSADAQSHGYRITDTQLGRLIRELSFFQREGEFDAQLYESLLRREGMSPSDFEAQRRREAVISQIREGLSQSAIVTKSDLNQIVRLLGQERDFAYAVINPESLISDIKVSDDAIQEYYSKQRDTFTTAEQIRVDYIELSAEELGKQYEPTEEELKAAYEAERARYVTPANRRARHILIEASKNASAEEIERARVTIEDIASQLKKGADFAALAKTRSQDTVTAAQGGDLGEIRDGMLPSELERALIGLKVKEVSAPVRTEYGFHLIELTGLTPEQRKPLSAARKELTDLIRARKSEERFYDLSEKFHNLIYEHPDTLKPAAEALGLEIRRSAWFGRNGGEGIASRPKLVEAAFDPEVLEQKRNSSAIEVDRANLLAVRLGEHRPAVVRPIAEVRGQIERELTRQNAKERSEQIGKQVMEELRGGKSLEGLAKSGGYRYQARRRFMRDRLDGVDARIAGAAFSAPRPQGAKPVYEWVDLGNQGYAIVALYEVSDADPQKADAALKERAQRLLTARRGSDYYSDYRAGLRRDADIKLFRDQL